MGQASVCCPSFWSLAVFLSSVRVKATVLLLQPSRFGRTPLAASAQTPASPWFPGYPGTWPWPFSSWRSLSMSCVLREALLSLHNIAVASSRTRAFFQHSRAFFHTLPQSTEHPLTCCIYFFCLLLEFKLQENRALKFHHLLLTNSSYLTRVL